MLFSRREVQKATHRQAELLGTTKRLTLEVRVLLLTAAPFYNPPWTCGKYNAYNRARTSYMVKLLKKELVNLKLQIAFYNINIDKRENGDPVISPNIQIIFQYERNRIKKQSE